MFLPLGLRTISGVILQIDWFSTRSELTAAMALLQTLAVAAALALLFTVARRAVQHGGE